MKIKFAAVVALCLLTAGLVAVLHVLFDQRALAQTTSSTEDDGYLNTVSLNFTSAYLDPLEGNSVVRAFVPTGSKSVNCLTSLSEIRSNSWPAGITVFCGEREPFGLGGVPGVLVSIFFSQPAPPDLAVSVTLYQKGAKFYGTPVLCNANNGC